METIISITHAKNTLLKLVRRAKEDGEVFTLVRGGEPEGVVMSYEEYESMKETLDILSDRRLLKKVRKGLKEVRGGPLLSHKEVFGEEI